MVTSEANPLVKSGGLADVTYSLSRELNKMGHETAIFMPYYKKVKEKVGDQVEFVTAFDVFMSWRTQYAGVFKLKIDGITYFFIDNEFYFNRDELYGYGDDGERFAFLSLATIVGFRILNWKPDIVHVHDWQAGMIPCLLKERFGREDFYKGIKSVLTIHNPAFKGLLDKYFLNNFYGLQDTLFYNGNVRFDGMVSTLKAAIYYADMITTVSPTHREELLSYQLSHGLNYCLELRKDDFVGIINGIDEVEFNPMEDKYIKNKFNKDAYLRGKSNNKKDVLEAFHMPQTKGPVIGLVSRLTWQKGIELLWSNLEHLVGNNATLLVVGSGEKEIEQKLQEMRDKYPNNIGIYIGYNNELAHKVYAGADFFLMPSLFEPCGIGQLIAERYGALPIVRVTGGLKDTVTGYDGTNLSKANGFTFGTYDSLSLGRTFDQVFEVYGDKTKMGKLIVNAMKTSWSWNESAQQYISVYERAKNK